MSHANPYAGLPPSAFWRSGVVETSPAAVGDIYRKAFAISADDRIVTAGSCFAQHIGRFLSNAGFNLLDAEPAPAWLRPELRAKHGYGLYSARYGNIYSSAQLAQLAAECAGAFTPAELVWRRGDHYVDAMRPGLSPEGFETPEELLLVRRFHLERVQNLFRAMDVFIFTLGLTEIWTHRESGTVFPTAPGVIGGAWDSETYGFVNLKQAEVVGAFERFMQTLRGLRGGSLPRIILTVSPVPLTATASGQHILPATTYSKSVLRAAAGELAQTHAVVDYFPSYEIVTNPAARGAFFDDNLRTVQPEAVEAVMASFFAAHPPIAGAGDGNDQTAALRLADQETELFCEEALLEAFGD